MLSKSVFITHLFKIILNFMRTTILYKLAEKKYKKHETGNTIYVHKCVSISKGYLNAFVYIPKLLTKVEVQSHGLLYTEECLKMLTPRLKIFCMNIVSKK